MMVIITYDVETLTPAGKKRLRLVARECKNYGIRVQNSVFECILDQAQLLTLKNSINNIIDQAHDSVRFYLMGNNWERHIETLGQNRSVNLTDTLII